MDTKFCSACQRNLARDLFSKRKDRKDGLRSQCRECTAQAKRDWYASNPANKERHKLLIKKNNEKYVAEKKAFLYEYLLSHPCVDCGEKDPIVLDFDHIEPQQKSFQISNAISTGKSIKTIKSEIEKCVVRCANCHRKRTAEQFGWWKHNFKN